MPQIVVENLVKTFRVAERAAGLWGAVSRPGAPKVSNRARAGWRLVSLDAGELVGYIGPNGAGKSTTVKMLAGHPGA